MNTTHFRFELRTKTIKSDGSCTIFLYANVNGERKYYSLHYSILPDFWNKAKQCVYAKCDNWHKINNTIDTYRSRADQLKLYADLDNRVLKISELDEAFRGFQFDKNSIVEFIKNDIKQFGNKFTPGTIANYRTTSNKLNEFRQNITFQDLSPFMWRQFENHLRKEGNNQNTILKRFKTLKVFIHRAIEQDIIKENPLKKVTVSRTEGQMFFLTFEEVKILEKIYNGSLTKDLKKTLQYFLFACYTGLRYSDIKSLKFKNITDNISIDKQIVKTKSFINIPLSERAKKLLPLNTLPEKPVFNVYCNQATNRHLKSIMILAKISKRISFHSARHTFATITLELTGDISAVQKLCGHTKIETTLLYAKVLDKSKQKAINAWDNAG